jgi:predicted CXXCH cytochrome family protein
MRPAYWIVFLVTCVTPLAPRLLPAPPDPRCLPDSAVDLDQASSNVLPEDYVGPAACQPCHSRKYELWSRHPHSRMNQLPGKTSVLGDFNDAVLRLPQATVTFQYRDGVYGMQIERDGMPLRRYDVTRTVGSRFMQFYIGVQCEGPEPAGHPVYREHMLPFAWWVSLARWLPKHYFDADGAEELLRGVPVVEGVDRVADVRPYTEVCMNCHNTFAYAYRIFDPMFVGFPGATVAAAVGPLSERLSESVPVRPSAEALHALNSRLDPDRQLVTFGISCESCHFGCREHAQSGGAVHALPTSPLVRVSSHDPDHPLTDSRKDTAVVNGICAQCHSGNVRFFPNCAAQGNSREALDFARGACASQLRCVSCHEPHTAGSPPGSPDRPEQLALCTTCHESYRDQKAAMAHGRHPASAGVTCLDCHMPRYTLGLEEVVRTHRISLPVEQSMVSAASANACNLCHLDRSLRWTADELEKGWGQHVELPTTGHVATAVDQPMGRVWLTDKDAAMRLVAGQAYARSPLGTTNLDELLNALNDSEPINRVFALKAIERIRGEKLPPESYSLTGTPLQRAKESERLGELLRKSNSSPRTQRR